MPPGKPGKAVIHMKKVDKTPGMLDFSDDFYFAKILTKLFDFRKLQSIDQRLVSWGARVKSTWNCTDYIEFHTWKLCIFHLENLEFNFENPAHPD